jgi:nucleoid DNA-binding protein
LALLPPKTLLGEVEKVIGQMNVDITKLEVSKPKMDSNFREVSTEFGIFHIIIQGKIIYLQYFEPSEKLKEVMVLAEYIDAMNVSETNQILCDKNIRLILEETLKTAKHEVDIVSPWANYWVMNSLEGYFKAAIKRGVTIKILYGIGNFNSNNESTADTRNIRTDKVINQFYLKFEESNRFKIHKDNTHIKLLICDDSYYVQGSFNFLSYDGNGDRKELAQYSEDKKLLSELRETYFAFD